MTITLPVRQETRRASAAGIDRLAILTEIERKVLWLASYMIHNANHLRDSRDGLKVGGHQSSCASAATLMTALFMHTLRPTDRIAVKPHASPVLHAIQYLLGHQTREKLERFRALGGAQAYPSRTKDTDGVDFSTGSVGLGVGVTLFASIVQDFLSARVKGMPTGRMVAVMGDAELDEGNVFEALLEGWKHDVRNLWWVIDYNRHSLDGTVNDMLFQKITSFFETVGWTVVNIKYGKELTAAFDGPAGPALRAWIDACPNQLYSALTFKGGPAWREHLARDLAGVDGIEALLGARDDESLHRLMTNLGGHDMASLIEAFDGVEDDTPRCFIAYTIKGHATPLAGHRDNHAGLMTPAQMASLQAKCGVADGKEWEPLAGVSLPRQTVEAFLQSVPWRAKPLRQPRHPTTLKVEMPAAPGGKVSTQAAFGTMMAELSKREDAFTARLLTTSPDVAVSTNLTGWINRRGVFHRSPRADTFRDEHVATPLKWTQSPTGQHVELGIAENNLFLMLAAAGLSEETFGERLLPVGTVYDPFVNRGLDALIYACYQDARFMLVGTPSGIALAPEGGAHQSINTPLTGMSIPNLESFEPAFADELGVIMGWGFQHMQRRSGGSVYLRLSTRGIEQPARTMSDELARDVIAGAYWRIAPSAGCQRIFAYSGVVAPEAAAAFEAIAAESPEAGLLAITSAGRLHADWLVNGADSHIARQLASVGREARIVSVLDGHPATLSWLGAVSGHAIRPLGLSRFGQSADIADLFAAHGIDAAAIVAAAK